MYRIAIVDDEQIVKLAVKSMIDWNSGEYELAGTAGDGQAALQLLAQTRVDILITDLKMPRMDGIELIGILRRQPESPAILVLSNHGDFQLVRDAMRLGARDYLLKTDISPEILMRSLGEITTGLDRPAVATPGQAGFLVRLADGTAALEQRMRQATPDEEACSYTLLLTRPRPDENPERAGDGGDLVGLLGSLAEQGLKACRRCLCARGPAGEGLLVALVPPAAAAQAETLATWLADQARLHYGRELDIIHSPLDADRGRFGEVLADCLRATEYFFYENLRGTVLALRDYPARAGRPALSGQVVRQEGNPADWIGRLVDWCATHRISPRFLKEEICGYLSDTPGTGVTADAVMAADSDRELLALFVRQDTRQFRVEVQKVLDYIASHPSERISVSRLAQSLRMSETYLCTLFKAQTGKSIISYINDAKLDRARDMLATGRYLIKEVAAEVGIEDPFYFNRLFKRRFGTTPSEFLP